MPLEPDKHDEGYDCDDGEYYFDDELKITHLCNLHALELQDAKHKAPYSLCLSCWKKGLVATPYYECVTCSARMLPPAPQTNDRCPKCNEVNSYAYHVGYLCEKCGILRDNFMNPVGRVPNAVRRDLNVSDTTQGCSPAAVLMLLVVVMIATVCLL